MKLLILGATGRTGKLVLSTALKQGFEVNCLARNSNRIPSSPRLQVFEGNPGNSAELETALKGCEYVINALNISRTSDFPWARLRTPATYLSEVMKTLLPLAKEYGIKGLIICSAWGVAATKKDIPYWFRWMIDYSNIGVAYRDHERQEELLTNSSLAWTIVRPVGLTNSRKEEKIKVSLNNSPKPSLMISRRSLAKFLVQCIKEENYRGKRPVISKS
ncbi:MAG: NAD(P)H-binding protein [Bacteroidota bacterium]